MIPDTPHSFRDFFKQATALEHGPYPYQERLASEQVGRALDPCAAHGGKAAAVIVGTCRPLYISSKLKACKGNSLCG
jgi:hypothetical protein